MWYSVVKPNQELQMMYTYLYLNRKPCWARISLGAKRKHYNETKVILGTSKARTVCQDANCPNIHKCFKSKSAAFIVMGASCTRSCSFCSVHKDRLLFISPLEPFYIIRSLRSLHLTHIVMTSVNRDDLSDGGVEQFIRCVIELKRNYPKLTTELLVPDFKSKLKSVCNGFKGRLPNIINHNIETIPRLYTNVKLGAEYLNSVLLLGQFNKLNQRSKPKSGIILGFGEAVGEVLITVCDLRSCGISYLTLGQLLKSSQHKPTPNKYLHPNIFKIYKKISHQIGIHVVASEVMARSSLKIS
ncbi:lipoyl synthase [Candidatus Tremblaya phenacola]|uniref:lipoyl synthase n=1 Tax=Candidatus Tremblayella phenacoccinincola TaxID=1010676 RepID=UPI0013303E57|nr:lipoyl synthase [Candidatus Tremblaya phenacola]KAH0998213.1 Lipoyl synthase [Candidatus Tremblaya phenacola]